MTTPVLNTVLVRCSNTYQDDLTVDDTRLLLDTSFRPEWQRNISEEAVAVSRGSGWIQSASEKLSGQEGILRFIGKPKTDLPALNVRTGDRVGFSKNADFIENKEYFFMQQEDLLATQPQKANEIESDYSGPRHYYETSPFYLNPDHD